MDNIQEKLNQSPPREALSTRKQAGVTLTYLEGHYVIEKMNEIFGYGGWERGFVGSDSLRIIHKAEGVPEGKTNTRYDIGMLCVYRIRVGTVETQDVGYGSGMSYNSYGDAHESAAKEAVTDALKRCCRSLGNAMGNCLYDKKWLKNSDKIPPKPQPKPKIDLGKLKTDAGIEWIRAFGSKEAAIAEISSSREITPEAIEFLDKIFNYEGEGS